MGCSWPEVPKQIGWNSGFAFQKPADGIPHWHYVSGKLHLNLKKVKTMRFAIFNIYTVYIFLGFKHQSSW